MAVTYAMKMDFGGMTGTQVSSELLKAFRRFIVEALAKYEKDDHLFAITNSVTALELLLKARLAQIHPTLIYEKIDTVLNSSEKSFSIRLSKISQRLKNFNVQFSKEEETLISEVAYWRNSIVHHIPDYPNEKASARLGHLFKFMTQFLLREFRKDIKTFLPRRMYRRVKEIVKDWDAVVAEARQIAEKEGSVIEDAECSNCWNEGVVCEREGGVAYCHYCEDKFKYEQCNWCGSGVVVDFNDEFPYFHQICQENALAG